MTRDKKAKYNERDEDDPAKLAARSTLVILITCETLGDLPDEASVIGSIRQAEKPVRVIMSVTENSGLPLAHRMSRHDIEVELLLGPAVRDQPPLGVHFARFPWLADSKDQDEFALALSDVMIVDPARHSHALVRRALELGKPVIAPGAGLPALPEFRSVGARLDPLAPQRTRHRHYFSGRLEQFSIELLGLLVPQEDSFRVRLKRVADCLRFNGVWGPKSWFPRDCENYAPDARAYEASSPLVTRFVALDRSAVLGAYRHRDLTWIAHFGAAWAVLAAVAGAIVLLRTPHGGATPGYAEHASLWTVVWAIVELLLLLVVLGIVFYLRRGGLRDRWTACRLGAEQLRIARMCLPLLVLQRALISPDEWPGSRPLAGAALDLTRDVLSEVKRAIRAHGLPRPDPGNDTRKAACWVKCIVDDQILYHERNHRKLECAERSLRLIADGVFLLAFAAVVVELASHYWPCLPGGPWLLVLTAAGPAFAGAFHGAATRLAITDRIALSQGMEQELRPIQRALHEVIHRPVLNAKDWGETRGLAFRAADAMGRENQSWLGLVRLQRDTLPA